MGKRNAKRADKGCLCILSHNVNSLSNLKLQNCYDIMVQNTTPVLCLQETKIVTIKAPPGYRVEHSPRVGKRGGGLATILPSCIPTLQVQRQQYVLYTQLVTHGGMVVHLLNIYLPPHSSDADSVMLAQVMDLLDAISPTEPTYLVGDFNAHMVGALAIQTTCPCHRAPLHVGVVSGSSCGRGRRLWSMLQGRGMHVLNGCQHM